MEFQVFQRDIPLPEELLSEIIFKFIPMCQWSSCLEYVSKQYRYCVLIAYSRIKSINFKKLFSLTLSAKNFDSFTEFMLFSLNSSPSERIVNVLTKLITVCPNLTEVDGFEYMDYEIDGSIWNLMKKADQFQSVSVDSILQDEVPFEHFADFVHSSKSLKKLKVSCCNFDVDGILNVGSLTNVEIHEISDDYFYKRKLIFLENLSEKLTSLSIGSFGRSFQSISDAEQGMKMCTKLESFSVSIYTMDDYTILFKTLPYLFKLTSLKVSAMRSKDEISVKKEFCDQLDLIKNQLQFVEFSNLNLSTEVQQFFFTKCLRLSSLNLGFGITFSENVLKNLSKLPCTLEKLKFSDTDKKILPLLLPNLIQLPNLTDLDISGSALSEEWENICYLNNLRNLSAFIINDALLDKWDKKNDKMFERLISLEISSSSISDAGACLLAKKAKILQILDLNRSKIGEKGISALGNLKKLTTAHFVRVQAPYLFDENDIVNFVKKAVSLRKLEIDSKLARKVIKHKDFLPFVEDIQLSPKVMQHYPNVIHLLAFE